MNWQKLSTPICCFALLAAAQVGPAAAMVFGGNLLHEGYCTPLSEELSKSGIRMPLLMPDDFEEMNLVAWRIEQGQPDKKNPLLEPEMPWDAGGLMSHGTILRDPIDSLWKAWQISTPIVEPQIELGKRDHVFDRRLTYLESKDGIKWYRPKLSLVPWEGYDKTNILLDESIDGLGNSTYASVFVNPNSKDWPYTMFLLRGKTKGHFYRSKDGKKWELVAGNVNLNTVGQDNGYVYHPPDGSYFSYGKHMIPPPPGIRLVPYDNNTTGKIRAIGIKTSLDGNSWSEPKTVLAPDWRDPPDTQYMEILPLKVLGGYVGIVTVYHTILQTTDLQLAASRDGLSWWMPDRRPALPNLPLGEYGGGMIWPMKNIIVQGNKMHIYYSATEGIHCDIFDTRFDRRLHARGETTSGEAHPTLPFFGALCRATWRLDRLWALVGSGGGPSTGAAVTKPQNCTDKELWVNIKSRPGGTVQAELLTKENKIIPGFSREDCIALTGDYRAIPIKWKGGSHAPTEAVKIKFYLTRTFLYGFQWRLTEKGQ